VGGGDDRTDLIFVGDVGGQVFHAVKRSGLIDRSGQVERKHRRALLGEDCGGGGTETGGSAGDDRGSVIELHLVPLRMVCLATDTHPTVAITVACTIIDCQMSTAARHDAACFSSATRSFERFAPVERERRLRKRAFARRPIVRTSRSS
jgi:hypothetical protein